jgi:hypothetical protein
MAWFRKKADPITDRARTLTEEIAALEEQIKQLDAHVQENLTNPRLRSTALPRHAMPQTPPPAPAPPREPVFEEVDQNRLQSRGEIATPDHYNELGVRKYDLPGLFRRLRSSFRGPSTTNPKLVSYLAAGGIQGLRPLRYEKRVARNRFIALVIFLFVVLLGIILAFYRHR